MEVERELALRQKRDSQSHADEVEIHRARSAPIELVPDQISSLQDERARKQHREDIEVGRAWLAWPGRKTKRDLSERERLAAIKAHRVETFEQARQMNLSAIAAQQKARLQKQQQETPVVQDEQIQVQPSSRPSLLHREWEDMVTYLQKEHEVGSKEDIGEIAVLVCEPSTGLIWCRSCGGYLSQLGTQAGMDGSDCEVLVDFLLRCMMLHVSVQTGPEKRRRNLSYTGNHGGRILCTSLPRYHCLFEVETKELDVAATSFDLYETLRVMLNFLTNALRVSEDGLQLNVASAPKFGHACQTIKLDVKACWRHCFASKIVFDPTAESTVAQLRAYSWEKAPLCVRFDWLVTLTCVRFWVVLDNGLCLMGPRSILIPVERDDRRSGRLHWHLLVAKEGQISQHRSTKHNLRQQFLAFTSTKENWLRCHKVEELLRGDNKQEHLLSWCTDADLTLGQSGQTYALRRTTARQGRPAPGQEDSRILSYLRPLNTIEITRNGPKLGAHEVSRLQRQYSFEAELDDIKDDLVLMYNPETRQAWMVPSVHLVLHLTIAFIQRRSRDARLHNMATNALYRSRHEDPARILAGAANIQTGILSVETVKDVTEVMLQSIDSIALQYLEAGRKRQFYGYEAYDMLYPKRYMQIKTAHLSRSPVLSLSGQFGWHKLLPEMEAVVFFKDLCDPIVPLAESAAPPRLPPGRNLLAVPTSCLLNLFERYNSDADHNGRMGHEAYWQCHELFGSSLRSGRTRTTTPFAFVAHKPNLVPEALTILQAHPNSALILRPDSGMNDWQFGTVARQSTLTSQIRSRQLQTHRQSYQEAMHVHAERDKAVEIGSSSQSPPFFEVMVHRVATPSALTSTRAGSSTPDEDHARIASITDVRHSRELPTHRLHTAVELYAGNDRAQTQPA